MAFSGMPLGSVGSRESVVAPASCRSSCVRVASGPWARRPRDSRRDGGATQDPCSVQTAILSPLLAACFEALIHGLRIFRRDRYLLVLLSEFLVDEGDGVIAGRKALDLIRAIFGGDGEERALHHIDIHLHPRMLVTLDRQHDFFAGEIFLDVSGGWRLRVVPLPVVRGRGMDVVSRGIVILDVYRLPCHHTKNVGGILET